VVPLPTLKTQEAPHIFGRWMFVFFVETKQKNPRLISFFNSLFQPEGPMDRQGRPKKKTLESGLLTRVSGSAQLQTHKQHFPCEILPTQFNFF